MENIIEYLIPLIFILAYVFPKAFKKKGAKGKPTPAEAKKKSPGLFDKLNKMLEEISEKEQEAVKQKKQQADAYDEWPNESYRDDDDEESTQTTEDTQQDAPQPAREAEPDRRRPPEEVTGSVPGLLPLKTAYPSQRYVPANISNRELRKAIVWSEILAPPKALRDE